MSLKFVQVIMTTDGKQFTVEAEAVAHQNFLDNQAVLEKMGEVYVNTKATEEGVGLVGRARAATKNSVMEILAYLLAEGLVAKEDLELVEAVEVSAELQARLDAVPKIERKKKVEDAPVSEEADLADFA